MIIISSVSKVIVFPRFQHTHKKNLWNQKKMLVVFSITQMAECNLTKAPAVPKMNLYLRERYESDWRELMLVRYLNSNCAHYEAVRWRKRRHLDIILYTQCLHTPRCLCVSVFVLGPGEIRHIETHTPTKYPKPKRKSEWVKKLVGFCAGTHGESTNDILNAIRFSKNHNAFMWKWYCQ